MSFGTVAILGPGLIGGSLALALAERGLADKMVIYARSDKSFSAIQAKLPKVELTTDVVKAVTGADIVVLCVPIETMGSLVKQFAASLKPTAMITDVGSVKGSVDTEIAPLLSGKALWIGSHPMAGSEQTGFSVARADLLQDAAVIITPTEQTHPAAVQLAEVFWKSLGGQITFLTPQKHDLSVAQISHLPHLIAAALVNQASEEAQKLSGGGFRDTTRIASGSSELWTEILFANSDAVTVSLRRFISDLEDLHTVLESASIPSEKSQLHKYLKSAQDSRSQLLEKKSV